MLPGEIVDVRPLGAKIIDAHTSTLIGTEHAKVVRVVLKAGKTLPEHKAKGEIVVQCLEGRVVFSTLGKEIEIQPGQLIYLNSAEPHSVRALEDSSFLLTVVFCKDG
jgi:quercetin dioxygenase-like cupin family protein